jgi:hypothetical protein
VEQAQPFQRAFPWRAAALAAGVVALAELAALVALAAGSALHARVAPLRHARQASAPAARGRAAQRHAEEPLRPRSRVSVLVLNGNGIAHAAGEEASRLRGRGYRRTAAANAGASYARSLVLFRPGFGREAARLARDAHIPVVAPLDGRLPATDAGYQLVLILGRR